MCDYRFFGKASHRLSLPNLNNLTIFKNDSAVVGVGNEIGWLTIYSCLSFHVIIIGSK